MISHLAKRRLRPAICPRSRWGADSTTLPKTHNRLQRGYPSSFTTSRCLRRHVLGALFQLTRSCIISRDFPLISPTSSSDAYLNSLWNAFLNSTYYGYVALSVKIWSWRRRVLLCDGNQLALISDKICPVPVPMHITRYCFSSLRVTIAIFCRVTQRIADGKVF